MHMGGLLFRTVRFAITDIDTIAPKTRSGPALTEPMGRTDTDTLLSKHIERNVP
jgi:hypothetical protein